MVPSLPLRSCESSVSVKKTLIKKKPPGGFFDVRCCCYFILTFYVSELLFLATGTPSWLLRPVRASISSELYPGYLRLLYFFQAFPSQFYRENYGFERFFTHRRFFPCTPSPHFLTRCVTPMRAWTPHPGSSSVSALTELSPPADVWPWTTHIVVTRPLIYQLCQRATKYRVKVKLLHMFCFFKVYGKTIKTFWARVDKKYCL